MLSERNQAHKKYHTRLFHLYKVLKNANESIGAESRPVVTRLGTERRMKAKGPGEVLG